jgi:hypothetical protein
MGLWQLNNEVNTDVLPPLTMAVMFSQRGSPIHQEFNQKGPTDAHPSHPLWLLTGKFVE